jgi:hypothetical protein
VATLSQYNFTIRYLPGTQNVCADFLSRLPMVKQSVEWVQAALASVDDPVEPVAATLSQLAEPLFQIPSVQPLNMSALQQEDSVLGPVMEALEAGKKVKWKGRSQELREFVRQTPKLVVKEGVLFRKATLDGREVHQLCVPKQLRQEILTELHDNMGHVGRDRTIDLIRSRVYWPRWHCDVVEKVKNCRNCVCRKTPADVAPLVPIVSTQPLELVCMDFLKLEPSQGYQNILVITDHFTKFAVAVPTKN